MIVRERSRTPADALAVLYVGSFAPEKRLDRLLAGFSKAIGAIPSFLWLVGQGAEQAALQRRAVALGIGDRVRFLGVRRNVASYYAAADVFAMTSDTEGIPGALLEAAYCRLPVVATDVGLVARCVLHGESGFLTACDDSEVGSALERLLADADLRRRFGERGRALVEERFLMSDVAGRYERFYERVLAETGRR
jgi:glycosyltransferase involved in cell wall biosynthesis